MNSTNKTVQNALAARNDAYKGYEFFKSYKRIAQIELQSLTKSFAAIERSIVDAAQRSIAASRKTDERECIEECRDKCIAALRRAYAEIQAQATNVMR